MGRLYTTIEEAQQARDNNSVGLKGHLEHDCEKYMESETTARLFNY